MDDDELLKADRRTMRPVQQLIARGQKEGDLRDDLSPQWMFDAIEALIYTGWIVVERDGLGLGEVARRVMVTITNGFGANSGATG